MKISESRLRKIIMEELMQVLDEKASKKARNQKERYQIKKAILKEDF